MEIKRGDIVIVAAPEDDGKARPAVVIQSELFNPTHTSVVVCLITTVLADAPFRIAVPPGRTTGLREGSQVMVDKVIAVPRSKISSKVGRLNLDQLNEVDTALRLWLGL